MTKQTVRFAVLASAVVVTGAGMGMLVSGCASDSGAHQASADKPMKRRRASGQGTFESSSGAREMSLDNEIGVYDASDVEAALREHMDEIRDCYGRAGKAQRYAGGQVTLRFLVDGAGAPSEVLVIASDLGSYEVERCLVETGRRIKFPPPDGRKATTFEYPVEFRSSGQMVVQDIDDSLKIERDLAAQMPALADCGTVSPAGAQAILYVEPHGGVGSVGLAADGSFDEAAGSCVVRGMRRWHMSASLPGRMLRCKVSVPAVIAAVEPPAPRPGALSASVRKRRR